MAPQIKAGEYRQVVYLEKDLGTSRDAAGAHVADWQPYATIRASVEPISGREYFAAQQISETLSHRLRTRYRPDLTVNAQLRAVYNTRTLNIHSVFDREEAHVELEMLASEVVQ